MARVISCEDVGGGFTLLRACGQGETPQAGQFYLLRAWDAEPVLSRPLSVFDAQKRGAEVETAFFFRRVGRGTEILSRLSPGDEVTARGPLGRGFPVMAGRIALVGGGAGAAPLFYTARRLKAGGAAHVETYLGIGPGSCGSCVSWLKNTYRAVSDDILVQEGGFITDAVDVKQYDAVFACGPEPMLRALHKKCVASGAAETLFVSLEARMACGAGACFVCSRTTAHGNRKVCSDGPVFPAVEVFGP